MTQHLPPDILALFEPREPLTYWPPIQEFWWEREDGEYSVPLTGVGEYMHLFEKPKAKETIAKAPITANNRSVDSNNTKVQGNDVCEYSKKELKRNHRSKNKRKLEDEEST